MGVGDALLGQRVYVDANILVYVAEQAEPYASCLVPIFEAFAQGRSTPITSELTLAELLVKPLRERDFTRARRAQDYLLDSGVFSLQVVSRDILIEAATIRADHILRLPDAIHVATANATACDSFLTNDKRLRSHLGGRGIILSDYVSGP